MGLAVQMGHDHADYDSSCQRQAKICRGPDYGGADLRVASGFSAPISGPSVIHRHSPVTSSDDSSQSTRWTD